MNFYNLINTVVPFIILLILGLYLRKYQKNKKWIKLLSRTKTIFLLLLGWSVYGFLTNNDYNQQWGCIIAHEPIFSYQNILYSTTALILLSIGYFLSDRYIASAVLTIELFFWIYKLFIIKGGYAVGFGGVPSIDVLSFDIVALTLRLLLIKHVLRLNFNSVFILIPAFLIMTVKTNFYTTQQSIIEAFENYPNEIENQKKQIIGNWSGLCKTSIVKYDTIETDNPLLPKITEIKEIEIDTVSVKIDSNELKILGINEFENENFIIQFMTLQSGNLWNILPDSLEGDSVLMKELSTDLIVQVGTQNAGFELWMLTVDSLVINIDYEYELKLKREK